MNGERNIQAQDRIVELVLKAHRYAVREPESALTFARKAAEAICLFLYTQKIRADVEKIALDKLITQLRRHGVLSERQEAQLVTIQRHGNVGAHEYATPQRIDPEYVWPCIGALAQLVKWFYKEHLGAAPPPEIHALWQTASPTGPGSTGAGGLTVAGIDDLTAFGWPIDEILHEWIAIDYATIPQSNENNTGRHEQWLPVVLNNPETWRLLVDIDRRRVAGYWHFAPLGDEDFASVLEGKFYDSRITADRVLFLGVPGLYRVYFVAIAILPTYRTAANFRRLLDALFDQLATLADNDVYVEEIATNAFTPEGVALCRTLGMDYVRDHEEFGKIYRLRLLPPPQSRLMRAYLRFAERYGQQSLQLSADHRGG